MSLADNQPDLPGLNPSLLSSVRMDWNTPPEIVALIKSFKKIGLDPATDPSNPVGAAVHFSLPENDGLKQPWAAHGLVYINPPYGRGIGKWIIKAAHEYRLSDTEIIMLIPARTDTQWWQDPLIGAVTASAICFYRGRIKFVGAESSAPFPSAFLYWGKDVEDFADIFGDYGWVVKT